jgi:hypothetical protein
MVTDAGAFALPDGGHLPDGGFFLDGGTPHGEAGASEAGAAEGGPGDAGGVGLDAEEAETPDATLDATMPDDSGDDGSD